METLQQKRLKPVSGLEMLETCKRILTNHQYETLNHVLIDATTANAVVTVYDALKMENQDQFLNMKKPVGLWGDLVWKAIERCQ